MTPIRAMIEEAAQEMVPGITHPEDCLYWEEKAELALSVFIRRVLREPSPELLNAVSDAEFQALKLEGPEGPYPHEDCFDLRASFVLSALADHIEKEMA